MTTYMICNLIGLSSTCTNPILYGYLNKKNIKKLYFDFLNKSLLDKKNIEKLCYFLNP